MIFKVKNLGYIEEAEVDLSKDLIVFTGHNNTGKTYLAYAIYFLYKLSDTILNAQIEVLNSETNSLPLEFQEIYNELLEKKSKTFDFKDLMKYYDENTLLKILETALNSKFVDLGEDLFLTNNHFVDVKYSIVSFPKEFIIQKSDNEHTHFDRLNKKIGLDSEYDSVLYSTNKFDKTYKIEYEVSIGESDKNDETIKEYFALSLYSSIYSAVIGFIWNKKTYIAPAERNAINIFSKELSLTKNRVLKNKNGAAKDIQFLNRYPLPIQDNLEIAEDLAFLSKQKSDFAYLAEELEQDFLKGTISTNQYGQIEYTPDNMDKMNLEIHLTASMVKSLSNIVFYLRHLAQKGDCIIIDEPELNLHPDNQRKIARFIGRLVNEGFQVVISTHSDYIIKELNNMIMLFKAKGERDDLIKNLGFRGDELLKPEQVEAQLFTLNSRKPEKIPITDEGFEVSTINEVIEKQDNDLEKIYYELFQKVV